MLKHVFKGGLVIAALFLGVTVGRDLAHKYVPASLSTGTAGV